MPKLLFGFILSIYFVVLICFTEQSFALAPLPKIAQNANAFQVLPLHFVIYKEPISARPLVSREQAGELVTNLNRIYSVCSLQFQIQSYRVVKPENFGLSFHPSNYQELSEIRKFFNNRDNFVAVLTGKWDRSGTLGNTIAHAWSLMPGEGKSKLAQGAILEYHDHYFAHLLAHEMGHYLNLEHFNQADNLMNSFVSQQTTRLEAHQCFAMKHHLE